MDFINLLTEEWSYHLMNIGILIAFSLYGAHTTVKKKIKLEIFRAQEKCIKPLAEIEKIKIESMRKQSFLKEFFKAFFAFFVIYAIYIIYRSGIFK